MSDPFTLRNGLLYLRVRLTPKAAKERLGGVHRDEKGVGWLKGAVRAPPEKGRANWALVELMARTFKIRKSAFTLQSGESDRHKTFVVDDPGALEMIKGVCGETVTPPGPPSAS